MPPGITPFSVRPRADAAGVLEDDLAQRRAERQLVEAGPHRRGRDTPKIVVPGLFSVPKPLEPLDAARHDVRHVREGLDVVHGGRQAEGAVLRGERRLLARLALLALERLEQARSPRRRCTRPAPRCTHDVVARSPLPRMFLPRSPLRVRLVDRALQDARGAARTRRGRRCRRARAPVAQARDQDAFEQLVRAALDDQPVLERAGLGLVARCRRGTSAARSSSA